MTCDAHNAGLIQVLVADDSAFMRTALTRMIESDPLLRVVGTAQNGLEVLDKLSLLDPDVITLDIEMPRLNGIDTLRRIMAEAPRPVIMVSSLTQEGANTTLEALALGAFDCVPKQLSYVSLDIVKIREDLIAKIKAAVDTRRHRPSSRVMPQAPSNARQIAYPVTPCIVAIGTSTGGPRALQEILPMLPADLPVGVVIVQHMPRGFTGPFANRLNNLCQISVREAKKGDLIERGVVLIAPAGQHLTVARRSCSQGIVQLASQPDNTLHMPSVDVMMMSVAESFGSQAMGIIMTGMGSDGCNGMKAIAGKSGVTVGQDEASCTVYGMPKSCAETGSLQTVVPLREIPNQILRAVHYRKST
jgi:two-component system chemotaxis response regulator CheB